MASMWFSQEGASPGTPTSDDRSQAFRPVSSADSMQSGEKLLVEAYAAIWLILFVFLLLSWRRQKKIDARVGRLEAALAEARKKDAGAGGAG